MENRPFHVRGVFAVLLLAVWVTATVVASGGADNTTTTPAASGWLFECAACFHTFYDLGPRSAQVDAGGVVHVVYGGEALYHAWQQNDGWKVEVIDAGPQAGRQAALTIGADGTMHVVYLDEARQSLVYVYGSTGYWTRGLIISNIGDEPWPSAAISSAGQVHLAYRDAVINRIFHVTRGEMGWQFTTVEESGGHHPSLALDSGDRPRVSYVMGVPGELRYAYDDEGWQVETVYAETQSLQSALAIDAAGQPHIAYAGTDPEPFGLTSMLMYAYADADGWHQSIVDNSVPEYAPILGIGYGVSLVLDTTGKPHLSYSAYYSSVTSYPLRYYYLPRYASHSTGGWEVHNLDEDETTAETALTLDGTGTPLVIFQSSLPVFIDYGHGGDLLSRRFASNWQREVVDTSAVAGIVGSMALDAEGAAHISSVNTVDNAVLYTSRTTGGWQSERVATAARYSYLQEYTSLAVDASGFPHILSNTYTRVSDVDYSYRDEAGWTLKSANWAGDFHDLAVSADGQVHAVWRPYWHEGLIAPPLYYRPLRAEPTVEQELAGASDVRHASLAVDTASRPHVAYATGNAVVYTVRYNDGWHDEVVTNYFGIGSVTLALDASGQPHIAFYGKGSSDLFYAYRDPSGWHLEPIDSAGDVGLYPAIAVTLSGQPHISYYDASNQDLKYARRVGTGWVVETVASEGNVGLYTSIALYNGYPHISYHDATRGDLMYVSRPFIPVAFSYLPLVAR